MTRDGALEDPPLEVVELPFEAVGEGDRAST